MLSVSMYSTTTIFGGSRKSELTIMRLAGASFKLMRLLLANSAQLEVEPSFASFGRVLD